MVVTGTDIECRGNSFDHGGRVFDLLASSASAELAVLIASPTLYRAVGGQRTREESSQRQSICLCDV
jgi:hypothetical protein